MRRRLVERCFLDDAELYVISNEDITRSVNVSIRFKGFSGGNYIIYDAFENKAVRAYSESGRIDIVLHPYNAVVIILSDMPEVDVIKNDTNKQLEEHELKCTYEIEICSEENLLFFEPYKITDRTINITGKDELPRFSGNIKYKTVFEVDNLNCNILDLGYVGETAEVILNGQNIGVRLFPPYEFDMSKALRTGKNTLEVIVTNSYGYKMRDGFSKWMMFEPSGLIGPIKIKRY